MCIIVAVPQGKQVSKSTLKRCWDNNPHGGGFMYSNGNKVVTHKEMGSFKKYWKAYHQAREQHDGSFVHHFRISTHGKINETNCHPFLINKNLGFAHNGIIYAAPKSDNFSDTYMFNECILKNLPNNFLNNTAHVSLIEQYIGTGSKLAFLNTNNEITIINEKAGVWDDGVWYSNSGYKAYNYFDYGGKKVGSIGGYQPIQKPYATPTLFDNTTKAKPTQTKVYDDCGNCADAEHSSDGYSRVYENNDWDVDIWGNKRKQPTCEYCGEGLVTSHERINDCCTKCYNEIIEADMENWIGCRKRY